jgi:hypothetical protein
MYAISNSLHRIMTSQADMTTAYPPSGEPGDSDAPATVGDISERFTMLSMTGTIEEEAATSNKSSLASRTGIFSIQPASEKRHQSDLTGVKRGRIRTGLELFDYVGSKGWHRVGFLV